MYEFESYINSIIGSLKISKKKKKELAEEFNDHLESLKMEFIEKGFQEDDAIQKAIEIFGESNSLKKKLYNSLSAFRNKGNVLFGVVITLIMITFCYIPIVGTYIAFNNYNTATYGSPLFSSNIRYFVNSVLFFIPIGYFLSIILNKFYKVLQLASIYSVFGFFIGVFFSIALTSSVDVVFLLAFSASGLLGGMAGYVMLIAVDRLNMLHRNERVTRFFNFK